MGASLAFPLAAICGYLAGSIPFGLLITKAAGLGDIRQIGSGNIGATNVLRTGRKDLALATLLLDSLKAGLLALGFGLLASREVGFVAGAFAFVGHCYPVWLGFKGGKGVATFLGLMWALAWPVGLGCCIAWALAAFLTRISSMGGLMAAAISTFLLVLSGNGTMLLLGIALTLLVFWRHRANISRIRQGTEPRIGQKS